MPLTQLLTPNAGEAMGYVNDLILVMLPWSRFEAVVQAETQWQKPVTKLAHTSDVPRKNFWIVSSTLNAWAQKATQEGGKKHFQLNIKIKSSKRTNQQEHLELETCYTPGCIAKSPQVFATGISS